MSFCPVPIGQYYLPGGTTTPAACGRWDCSVCGPQKKHRLGNRVRDGFSIQIRHGFRIRAITLTQKLGTDQSIMKNWARLRANLKKKGYHLAFFWAKEFTIAGERHLHILVNAYIPWETLKESWWQVTGGESYIVWINEKDCTTAEGDIVNPAGYAMKYITKAFSNEVRFAKKEHRFGFSRHDVFRRIPILYGDFWERIMNPKIKLDLEVYAQDTRSISHFDEKWRKLSRVSTNYI